MKSVMSHTFSQVPSVQIPRSVFNRTHGHKTTFNNGYLIPFLVDEVLPGDSFKVRATLLARLSPVAITNPIMDNLFLDCFYFFVPLRLIWNSSEGSFQRFMGEQANPDDSVDFVTPKVATPVAGFAEGSLYDYFGVPTKVAGMANINNFHARAYNLVWNEFFRDQNILDSAVVDKDNGTDDAADYILLKRGKRHDYFTSSLPWPQKGTAVELPLGISAPVLGIAKETNVYASGSFPGFDSKGAVTYSNYHLIDGTTTDRTFAVQENGSTGKPNIYADLSAATAATINSLREAFQLQRLLERDARGGTRYTEIVRSHFGVVSPDARLQRPELLATHSQRMNISPVVQTAPTSTSESVVGKLAGMGLAAIQNGFVKSFVEHGVIIGLCSLRADLTYCQGLNRMFSRSTKYDYYWPALAHLGEQEVLNKEIYTQGTADDNKVFGYQERYAEYRYKPSIITGKFRHNATGTLHAWHLSQEFSGLPVLTDNDFIQENVPLSRVLAVNTEPDVIMDSFIEMQCARPMPVYSVPGLIDHF